MRRDRRARASAASFAIGAESGVSASFARTDWISATAALHYLATFGYAALDRDSYGGPSAGLGIELGL